MDTFLWPLFVAPANLGSFAGILFGLCRTRLEQAFGITVRGARPCFARRFQRARVVLTGQRNPCIAMVLCKRSPPLMVSWGMGMVWCLLVVGRDRGGGVEDASLLSFL